jgi:hypothetical protein
MMQDTTSVEPPPLLRVSPALPLLSRSRRLRANRLAPANSPSPRSQAAKTTTSSCFPKPDPIPPPGLIQISYPGRLPRASSGSASRIGRRATTTTATTAEYNNFTQTPSTTDPLEFLTTHLDFHPDPAQTTLIQSPQNRVIVNCCRQWGKSTLTAALAVFRSVSRPESLILILSPSERQSAEFLHKAATFLRRLGIRTRSDGHNSTSLLLPNRSRIIGLPARDATIRGFSAVSLLIIDEASRLPDPVYHAIRPMLAVSSGDLWLLSTPWGKTGFFYHTWANGGPQWTRLQVPASECPRIPAPYLEEERLTLGDTLFKQEYCCEFVDPIDSVFSLDDFDLALTATIPPIHPQEQR